MHPTRPTVRDPRSRAPRSRLVRAAPWVAALLAPPAVVLASIFAGVPDVAAIRPEVAAVEWWLRTARERSLARRAAELVAERAVPPLGDPRLAARGHALYDRLCAVCHGAPGVPRADLARGLAPPPPDLAGTRSASDLEAARDFLVVAHGIRHTGMPAFAPSVGEEGTWALVAFLRRLPELTAEEYAALGPATTPPPAGEAVPGRREQDFETAPEAR